ncbi:Putative outer membrane or secreted lipoprotein [Cronobacter condimenti 1330]|uniref:Putative outer membrane or secreted lipoprotein n=1 Tax=Cronobacter condimenti 1330 TaxID=1073999 RepID=K8ADT9_9ENTR|nr:Putative outer membrane or secreted lipoprotein [Cronobacter condimenti 1330]
MKLQRALKITLLPLLSVAFFVQAEKDTPPGASKTTHTNLLETGAAVLQSNAPLKGFDIYLVGFHPMKEIPEKQMEAHHYCHQVNEDFAQCVLFDGNTKDANMNGVEYIISEKLFNELPPQEKQYWHPHNGEILSGQLDCPGIPAPVEHRLMQSKMNSYGKTWHVWHTGGPGDKGDALPLGPPMLAWSFSRDGEAKPELVTERDKKLGVNTEEIRRSRADLETLAKPQSGVDALKGQFKRETKDIPGVVDSDAASKKQ